MKKKPEKELEFIELSQVISESKITALTTFKPTTGTFSQEPIFKSTKPQVVILAGNKFGKTYCQLIKAGYLLVPEKDIYNKNTGWLLDPYIRKRVPTGRRLQGWISTWSTDTQATTIQPTFDKTLGDYFKIRADGGIYTNATGEIADINFKTQKQGYISYTGGNIDYICADEPHSEVIYNEMRHRFDITKGTLWYGFTGIINYNDPDFFLKANLVQWFKKNVLEPYERDPSAFPLLDIFYGNTETNPLIDMEWFEGNLAGMSEEERIVRSTGRLIIITGQTFMSELYVDECRKYLLQHPEESEPEYGMLEYDDMAKDEYSIIFEKREREGFYPEYPVEGYTWKIWEHPLKDGSLKPKYFIGGDVAGEGNYGDYFCAYVIRGDNKSIVACLHGYMSSSTFAKEMWKAGYYYRDRDGDPAYLAVEVFWDSVPMELLVNGSKEHGIKPYRHKQIYIRMSEDITQFGQRTTANVGWKTGRGSRNQLLKDMEERLKSCYQNIQAGRGATVKDIGWFSEALDFMMGPKGKFEAKRSSHDDRLFACAIADEAHKQGFRPVIAILGKQDDGDAKGIFSIEDGKIMINIASQMNKEKPRKRTYWM
jgi:hypothetical protein